ncbi:MAG: ATP-binding protein [Dehalococcoidia bacterium]
MLLKLVESGSAGDRVMFRRAAEALIAEERGRRHDVLADQLEQRIRRPEKEGVLLSTLGDAAADAYVHATLPARSLTDLYLAAPLLEIVGELIEEQQRRTLLQSFNLEPRHRIMLVGPPGNGKTSLAEALAFELAVPLMSVRYDRIIGSYLGETAYRISQLFDFVRTRQCVLFFDEFDAIAKERGDPHDTGEVKRVVSSLLLQIDSLPSHVVVVTATNHPELLDRAVWRRFEVRLELPAPGPIQREAFLRARLGSAVGESRRSYDSISRSLAGSSFAELTDFVLDVQRRMVLQQGEAKPDEILKSRLRQWNSRRKVTGTTS